MISLLNCAFADNNTLNPANKRLFDYKDYKNLTLENIKSLKITRYTEGGARETIVDDMERTAQIYNFLSKIILENESNMSCTDNTTIYTFILKDGTKASVELECEWIVIKGKNYNFKY